MQGERDLPAKKGPLPYIIVVYSPFRSREIVTIRRSIARRLLPSEYVDRS